MTAMLVNEPLIRQVLENAELRKIPALSTIQYEVVTSGGCQGCGRRRRRTEKVPPTDAVKQILYRLPENDIQAVKSALNCSRLIFYFRERGMPPRAIR